ncbi:zinc finger protein 37 [Chanos chanos]|uniref:Zinc finger protein 37 n=1 Tax=Chanos chanos TaxID=29144 RepID=A0A6J2W3Y0_CHACN|nr:zinc finger protein 37-like [Chanos chanos]
MSINGSSPGSAFVAELPFSFQDELTATIQNALGVAVEIAVVEITKLVGQVLKDVRDQMQDTLRDNKSLKFRLHTAEAELCAVRGRLEEQSQSQTVAMGDHCSTAGRIQLVHQQLSSLSDSLQTASKTARSELNNSIESNFEQGTDSTVNVKQPCSAVGGIENNTYSSLSFCEIREDGRVSSQDIKPDLMPELDQLDMVESKVTKKNGSVQGETAQFEQSDSVMTTGPDAAGLQTDRSPTPQAASVVPAVTVKVEETEQGGGPLSASYIGRENDLSSEILSLAQSRLLEDWKPEPLHLQSCQSNTFTPSPGLCLESPLLPSDIPDQDLQSPSAPGLSVPFSKPYTSGDMGASSSLPNHSPPQLYPAHDSSTYSAQHVCRICGETFSQLEDLRKHRSLLHPKNVNKTPKRSLFPPGRSPYHCGICRRDFNRMEHLKIHQRIHTGERPYACSVCNARFRHSWALTRHFRIHTGEKPYMCGQCGKTFRNCGGLRFHQRSHVVGALGSLA